MISRKRNKRKEKKKRIHRIYRIVNWSSIWSGPLHWKRHNKNMVIIVYMKRHQIVFNKQHERKVYMQIVKIMANWERVTYYRICTWIVQMAKRLFRFLSILRCSISEYISRNWNEWMDCNNIWYAHTLHMLIKKS